MTVNVDQTRDVFRPVPYLWSDKSVTSEKGLGGKSSGVYLMTVLIPKYVFILTYLVKWYIRFI